MTRFCADIDYHTDIDSKLVYSTDLEYQIDNAKKQITYGILSTK